MKIFCVTTMSLQISKQTKLQHIIILLTCLFTNGILIFGCSCSQLESWIKITQLEQLVRHFEIVFDFLIHKADQKIPKVLHDTQGLSLLWMTACQQFNYVQTWNFTNHTFFECIACKLHCNTHCLSEIVTTNSIFKILFIDVIFMTCVTVATL